MGERIRWPGGVAKVAGELAIIVAGVLIALWADAWLQARHDRGAEARYLVALLEDIDDLKAEIAASNEQRREMFDALARIADTDLSRQPEDSVGRWVYSGLFNVATIDPTLIALRDMQASGQLGLLTPEIRRDIAELDRAMRRVSGLEDDFLRSQQSLMDTYLVRRLPLARILTTADSLPLAPRPLAGIDWRDLRTQELRNAIAFKLSLGKLATRFRMTAVERLDQLAASSRARLEALGVPPGGG